MGYPKRVYDFLLRFWPLTHFGYWLGRQPGIGWLARPFFSTRGSQATILPVNETIPTATQLSLPYALLRPLVERAGQRFILSTCMCRTQEHCQSYPQRVGCIFLGEGAGQIHPSLGRLVEVDEAMEHIRQAMEAGLVPMVAHSVYDAYLFNIPYRRMLAVCFCCPCCCTVRRGLRLGPPAFWEAVQRLPGLEVAAGEDCLLCGECQAACPVGAITLGEERALVGADCKGCGLCVEACPNGAMTFAYRPEVDILEELLARVGSQADIYGGRAVSMSASSTASNEFDAEIAKPTCVG
jgi:ferredoxin